MNARIQPSIASVPATPTQAAVSLRRFQRPRTGLLRPPRPPLASAQQLERFRENLGAQLGCGLGSSEPTPRAAVWPQALLGPLRLTSEGPSTVATARCQLAKAQILASKGALPPATCAAASQATPPASRTPGNPQPDRIRTCSVSSPASLRPPSPAPLPPAWFSSAPGTASQGLTLDPGLQAQPKTQRALSAQQTLAPHPQNHGSHPPPSNSTSTASFCPPAGRGHGAGGGSQRSDR